MAWQLVLSQYFLFTYLVYFGCWIAKHKRRSPVALISINLFLLSLSLCHSINRHEIVIVIVMEWRARNMIFCSHRSLAFRNAKLITLHRTDEGSAQRQIEWDCGGKCVEENWYFIFLLGSMKFNQNSPCMTVLNQHNIFLIDNKVETDFPKQTKLVFVTHAFKWSRNRCFASLALVFLLDFWLLGFMGKIRWDLKC